jgi:hypothetical protein
MIFVYDVYPQVEKETITTTTRSLFNILQISCRDYVCGKTKGKYITM